MDTRVSSGTGNPDPYQRIDELVARALEIFESEGKEGVERFLDQAGDDAATIRKHLSRLEATGLLDEPGPKESHPDSIADFRILAKLGKGGMGVVYLAEEKSLGRRVALKLVRPDQLLFPGARERFQREVQTVARLAHANIVPVYSVGEQDGVPWFAMEYVAGATLAEVIERCAGLDLATLSGIEMRTRVASIVAKHDSSANDPHSSSPRSRTDSDSATRRPSSQSGRTSEAAMLFSGSHSAVCARIARAAAHALSHAHERGVLHRDVKPSNMLLTTEGRVLLFDFGLATHDESGKLTRTGQRLGSLAYMSPEQLDGDLALQDARSDVYSLGVSLYEMLTLRLPFLATSGEALVSAIRDGRPIPPRTINPAIPRDLETVVLKAMDPVRARRYANALEFAEDLDNVLELRPIHARRPNALVRIWRLVQRRPLTSALAALLVLSTIIGAVAYDREQRRAAREVKLALDRAEKNLERALSAVESMLIEVGHASLKNVPQAEPIRRKLIEDAVEFYERFLEENPNQHQLEFAAMMANLKRADVALDIGDDEKARSSALRALALIDRMIAREPNYSAEIAVSRVRVNRFLERIFSSLGDEKGATAAADRALESALIDAKKFDACVDLFAELAGSYDSKSRRAQNIGDFATAESCLRSAIEYQTQVVTIVPEHTFQQMGLATYMNNLAELLMGMRRPQEAQPYRYRSIEILEELHTRDPDDFEVEYKLAAGRMNLARGLYQLGRLDDAQPLGEQALREFEALRKRFPENVEIERAMITMIESLVLMMIDRKQPEAALAYSERSIQLNREAIARDPLVRRNTTELGGSLANYAAALMRVSRFEDVVKAAAEGVELIRPLGVYDPHTRLVLRTLYQYRIQALLKLDNYGEAASVTDELFVVLGEEPTCQRIAGGLLARGMKNIAKDPNLDPMARERLLTKQTSRVVEMLSLAKRNGALTNADLQGAGDYEILRQRPEYEALLAEPEPEPAAKEKS